MTLPPSVLRTRPPARLLPAVVVAAVAVTLVSCSADDPKPGRAAASHSRSSEPSAGPANSRTPRAPTASRTPSLPGAADGTNARACADGDCEIRVTGKVSVPLPARLGVGTLQVVQVGEGTVAVVVPLTRSEFSSDGGCGATFTGPSGDASAAASLTCHAGEQSLVNKMSLKTVGIRDGAAVLRIRSAP